jgi:hypothetical protein
MVETTVATSTVSPRMTASNIKRIEEEVAVAASVEANTTTEIVIATRSPEEEAVASEANLPSHLSQCLLIRSKPNLIR